MTKGEKHSNIDLLGANESYLNYVWIFI
jgi:hypothetical protein